MLSDVRFPGADFGFLASPARVESAPHSHWRFQWRTPALEPLWSRCIASGDSVEPPSHMRRGPGRASIMRFASATISSERLFSRLEGLSAIARIEAGPKIAARQPFPTGLTSMRYPLYSIVVIARRGTLHFGKKLAPASPYLGNGVPARFFRRRVLVGATPAPCERWQLHDEVKPGRALIALLLVRYHLPARRREYR